MTPTEQPAASAPTRDVAARVRAQLPGLSPAEARVATLVLDGPDQVAHLTIVEMAAAAGCSTATVVRTARRLGFSGYPDLRLAMAEQAGRASRAGSGLGTAGGDITADITAQEPAAGILSKLAAFEAQQVLATAELVDAAVLAAVLDAVAGARRISVFGIGASGLVAQDLTLKLTRIGLSCSAHVERDAALVNACLLQPTDVAIAVSHSGENPGVTEPLSQAAAAGAVTVALTGAPRSAIARTAQHVLLTAGREYGLRSAAMASRSSQLLVVDALYVGVAYRTPGARAALERTYLAVRPSGRA